MRKLTCWFTFSIALALYGISFFLPVAGPYLDSRQLYGWDAFVSCFWTLFGGEELLRQPEWFDFVAGWLANPAAWFGFISWLRGKYRAGFFAGFACLALAAPLQVVSVWKAHDPSRELFGPGYWIWLASFVALVMANLRPVAAPPGSPFATSRREIQSEL